MFKRDNFFFLYFTQALISIKRIINKKKKITQESRSVWSIDDKYYV